MGSQEVGIEKPHPPIFMAALDRVNAAPEECLHVGDQFRSDVMGAQGVGMKAVLIDRSGFGANGADCPTIASLSELGDLVDGLA